jgi:hypothetical protein
MAFPNVETICHTGLWKIFLKDFFFFGNHKQIRGVLCVLPSSECFGSHLGSLSEKRFKTLASCAEVLGFQFRHGQGKTFIQTEIRLSFQVVPPFKAFDFCCNPLLFPEGFFYLIWVFKTIKRNSNGPAVRLYN